MQDRIWDCNLIVWLIFFLSINFFNFNVPDVESDNGFSSGIVFGRDFGRFRLEGEFSGRRYHHSTIDFSYFNQSPSTPLDGHTIAFGGLINALYDIELTKKIGIFIGAGTGVNGANIKLINKNLNDTLFAYQLLTGIVLDFAERASARLIYKYFTTAGSTHFDRLGSHNLELGIQVDLWPSLLEEVGEGSEDALWLCVSLRRW